MATIIKQTKAEVLKRRHEIVDAAIGFVDENDAEKGLLYMVMYKDGQMAHVEECDCTIENAAKDEFLAILKKAAQINNKNSKYEAKVEKLMAELDAKEGKKENTNDEKQLPAVIEKTDTKENKPKFSTVKKYVIVGGVGALVGGVAFFATKLPSLFNRADEYKPVDTTIETTAEDTVTADLDNIKTYNEVDFYTGVNDINGITDSFKNQGYLDTDKEVVLTEDGINSLYFMVNVSEMNQDARDRFISNNIVRDSSNAIMEDTRNALEVSNIIDNQYAKGEVEKYMDLSAFFAHDAEASRVYTNYVNALTALRNLKPEDKERINAIYQDAYNWAMDNNSATFGNPKSINNTGAVYVMNNLIRKNIVATMLEMGYINEEQYYAIYGTTTDYYTGETLLNTEIRETNDVINMLTDMCSVKTR